MNNFKEMFLLGRMFPLTVMHSRPSSSNLAPSRLRLTDYNKSLNTIPVSKSKILCKHEINLTDDIPVVSLPRVIPHSKKQQIFDQILQMLSDEIIQPSDSSCSNAVVPVIKKNGSIRMCIDYHQLNAKIIPKSYPIPRHEDLFDDFSDAEVFTVLDLSSTYWHIPTA